MLYSCDDCPGENGICEILTSVSKKLMMMMELGYSNSGLKMKNSQILPSFNHH